MKLMDDSPKLLAVSDPNRRQWRGKSEMAACGRSRSRLSTATCAPSTARRASSSSSTLPAPADRRACAAFSNDRYPPSAACNLAPVTRRVELGQCLLDLTYSPHRRSPIASQRLLIARLRQRNCRCPPAGVEQGTLSAGPKPQVAPVTVAPATRPAP